MIGICCVDSLTTPDLSSSVYCFIVPSNYPPPLLLWHAMNKYQRGGATCNPLLILPCDSEGKLVKVWVEEEEEEEEDGGKGRGEGGGRGGDRAKGEREAERRE